jgi:hypothetical protein
VTGPDAFARVVQDVIDRTAVTELLNQRTAIVLERVARGGGTTHWFYLDDRASIPPLAARLSPGSVVSFYFDERLRFRTIDDVFMDDFFRLIGSHGSAVVGRMSDDGLELKVDFPNALSDFTEFLAGGVASTPICLGAFPDRDNDGVNSVTVTLPDHDGVVRMHPH